MNIVDIYADLQPLKTKRMLLRKLVQDDINDMYTWASDPEVAQYVTWEAHTSIAETQDFIDRTLSRYKHAKLGPWAMVNREDNRMIGLNGFIEWETKHSRAELGYVLSKDCWGKGYMTESKKAIVDFGFQHMNLNRIAARCRVPNIGSARVMEKCGMTYEGIMRSVTYTKGAFHDLKLYAITKNDWREQKESK